MLLTLIFIHFIFKMIITFPSLHSSHFLPSYIFLTCSFSNWYPYIYFINTMSSVYIMSSVWVWSQGWPLNNQVGGYSKIILSTLSIHQEPTILYVGLRLQKIYLSHVSISFAVIVIQVLLRWPCWWGIIAVASLIFMGDPNLTANVHSSAY